MQGRDYFFDFRNTFNDADAEIFANDLNELSAPHAITITAIYCPRLTSVGVTLILNAIKALHLRYPKLMDSVVINFAYNNIDDLGAQAFANTIRYLTNLTTVDINLSGNNITNEGAAAIKESLQMPHKLPRKLMVLLGGNKIGKNLLNEIYDLLLKNESAHQIYTSLFSQAPCYQPREPISANSVAEKVPSPKII